MTRTATLIIALSCFAIGLSLGGGLSGIATRRAPLVRENDATLEEHGNLLRIKQLQVKYDSITSRLDRINPPKPQPQPVDAPLPPDKAEGNPIAR
jgi:hypothetical protein